jgi:hypothetical protein
VGASRAAPKEVDQSAFADDLHCGLPHLWFAHGLDYNVILVTVGNNLHQVFAPADVNDPLGPQRGRSAQSLSAPPGDADMAAGVSGQGNKHQANGARANYQNALTRAQTAILHTLNHTCQRLHEGGVPELGFIL